MRLSIAVRQRLPALAVITVLAVSVAAPVLQTRNVSAAQFTERQIRMGSSARGATDVTYELTFKPTQTGSVLGFVIQFCANSPLKGSTCTGPGANSLQSFTVNPATLAVTGWTVDTTNSTANTLIITRASGTFTSGATETITLGTAAAADGVTNPNPTAPATFYARIFSYAAAATASGYGADGTTPGTFLDDGGIALSTANQLTISARVQEQLEFCVASINADVDGLSNGDGVTPDAAELPTSCSHTIFTGGTNDNTVDLGVVDSTTPSVTPVATNVGGDNQNGGIMIRTNAAFGAVVAYYAEQDTGSGQLKVPGATCTPASNTDQCFNSAGATQISFDTAAAGEKFGMTAGKVVRPAGSTTTNLTRSVDYDGNGKATATACVAATVDSDSCFAWVETGSTSPTTIASSANVLDYEMLILNFAARSAATTPTGAYQVVSTYIATSKF